MAERDALSNFSGACRRSQIVADRAAIDQTARQQADLSARRRLKEAEQVRLRRQQLDNVMTHRDVVSAFAGRVNMLSAHTEQVAPWCTAVQLTPGARALATRQRQQE
jgi:hypothetical protein